MLTPFKAADIAPVDSRFDRQFFLGPADRLAQDPNAMAEFSEGRSIAHAELGGDC